MKNMVSVIGDGDFLIWRCYEPILGKRDLAGYLQAVLVLACLLGLLGIRELQNGDYDAVFVDTGMPVLDGIRALLKRLEM
jgi:CheY-like chemotaxis protein